MTDAITRRLNALEARVRKLEAERLEANFEMTPPEPALRQTPWLKLWCEIYSRAHQNDGQPVIYRPERGRDARILKELLGDMEEAEGADLIRRFHSQAPDEYLLSSGYSVPAFKARFQGLRLGDAPPEPELVTERDRPLPPPAKEVIAKATAGVVAVTPEQREKHLAELRAAIRRGPP